MPGPRSTPKNAPRKVDKPLPEFRRIGRERVITYLKNVFVNDRASPVSQFHSLVEYDDGHYRALFKPGYFVLSDDQPAPTKSQWNTLKKHMKRMNPDVFLFKEHGEVSCGDSQCFYVDFGFFAQHDSPRR